MSNEPTTRRGALLALGLFTLLSACRESSEPAATVDAEPQWIQLFNGEDLSGWRVKIAGHELGENALDTFRVQDGILQVRYDRYEKFENRFGHLFYDVEFSEYRMRVEYRFVGDQCPGGPGWAFRNSGVMIHGQPAETLRVDQSFPVSIEVQLLGGNGTDERSTANLCTPGTNVVMDSELVTRHCTNSSSPTFHGDRWVTVEIEVIGNEVVRHLVDGEVVMEYQNPQLDPNDADAQRLGVEGDLMLHGGTISLQAESHPVDFRRVELLPLED